jgi:hypothetical protein
VIEQALAQAVGILRGAFQRVGVVVHLDVADTILFDQTFDDGIEIAPHFGIAEIQQEMRVLYYAPAMPQEEPAIRLLCKRGVLARYFRLQPETGNHSSFADSIQDETDSARPP